MSLLTSAATTNGAPYFRAGPAAALTRVSKGNEMTARGTVQKAVIEGSGRALVLTVTLGEAQLP